MLILVIQRDGSISDVMLDPSTGTAAMDAALVRRFRQIRDIPAFTPDMPVSEITLPLAIGTAQG